MAYFGVIKAGYKSISTHLHKINLYEFILKKKYESIFLNIKRLQ